MPSIELPSLEDRSLSSTESLTDDANSQTGEPRRSGRGTRPTRNNAPQLSQEAAGTRAKVEGSRKEKAKEREGCDKGKGQKVRKIIPTSQLLEKFRV
jgi:hypothetical protein